ncbi:hypothetical protein M2128_002295, partial [Polynucleobacter sphagniphilus]
TVAPNTSGTASYITYNTTSGNQLSTISTGALTIGAGTSSSAINYIEKSSGSALAIGATTVPGYILLDNTYGCTGASCTPASGYLNAATITTSNTTTTSGVLVAGALSAGTYVTLNGATAGTNASNAGVQLGANISSSTLISGQGVNITAATGLYGDGIMMRTSAGAAASVTITSGTAALVGGDVNFLANAVNSGWIALYGYMTGNISITTYGANINLGTSLAPLAGGNAIYANSGNLFGTLRATTVGAGSGNINIYGLSTISGGNSAFGGTITADSAVTIYAKNSASTSTVSALATNAVITSNNSSATITGINQGTGTSGMAVTATGLITGNSIAVTGTSVAAATVVSLGAMTINACSAGVACNSNNISVTGN